MFHQNNSYHLPDYHYFLSSATHFNLEGICLLTGLNCTSHLDNQTRSQISCYFQSQESLSQELNQGWQVTNPIQLQQQLLLLLPPPPLPLSNTDF
jgi:hypothetical protein